MCKLPRKKLQNWVTCKKNIFGIRKTLNFTARAVTSTNTIKQDKNLTYRCALSGLRINKLFNLLSLPI